MGPPLPICDKHTNNLQTWSQLFQKQNHLGHHFGGGSTSSKDTSFSKVDLFCPNSDKIFTDAVLYFENIKMMKPIPPELHVAPTLAATMLRPMLPLTLLNVTLIISGCCFGGLMSSRTPLERSCKLTSSYNIETKTGWHIAKQLQLLFGLFWLLTEDGHRSFTSWLLLSMK